MKERSIIMSTQLIPQILADIKTQTRRVVKLQPIHVENNIPYSWGWAGTGHTLGGKQSLDKSDLREMSCPYGQVGDRLWVRETVFIDEDRHKHCKIVKEYKADKISLPENCKWIPPIFMPRWASRITLEITDIRVERLQEIKYDEIRAEGIEATKYWYHTKYPYGFDELWNSLAKKGFKWEDNSFVWVISFKRVI